MLRFHSLLTFTELKSGVHGLGLYRRFKDHDAGTKPVPCHAHATANVQVLKGRWSLGLIASNGAHFLCPALTLP